MSSKSQRDLDDLKGILADTTKQFLGFNEPSVASAALNCVTKGYDKNKTVNKLSDLLDGAQASSFADRIFSVYEEFQVSIKNTKFKRRKDEDEGREAKSKKRRFLDDDEIATIPNPSTPSPGALTTEKIKEMMATAQKVCTRRKWAVSVFLSMSQKNALCTHKLSNPCNTFLTLLDLSAAFDTIDHSLLFQILSHLWHVRFGSFMDQKLSL